MPKSRPFTHAGNWFSAKALRQSNGEREVFPTNGAGTTGYLDGKVGRTRFDPTFVCFFLLPSFTLCSHPCLVLALPTSSGCRLQKNKSEAWDNGAATSIRVSAVGRKIEGVEVWLWSLPALGLREPGTLLRCLGLELPGSLLPIVRKGVGKSVQSVKLGHRSVE